QGIFTLPSRFNLDNYLTAWQQGHFNLYFMNSILVVVPVVISSLLLGILSGFGFAFLRIPGKRPFAAALALGMVL
ncbi:carbohydrate ABC transporter permease, partial [Pectobacterium versatile]|nr:carbohydrate ABC transporter permease [Pectobacterium versatile]